MKAIGSYVWIWLPGDGNPTLCGFLRWQGRAADFAYVKSYQTNPRAISVLPDWSIAKGSDSLYPAQDDALPGFIADVAPGRWAEFVLERLNGAKANAYERLLQGVHARTGALEFGPSHREPPFDDSNAFDFETIASAVADLDSERPVDPRLRAVFRHGPSLGGRRPKATIAIDGEPWIGKFCSVQDRGPEPPRMEAFGLTLARDCGLDVPDFKLVEAVGKPVLLVKRFDRQSGGRRHHVLSARTLLNLSERQSLTDGSYVSVAQLLRRHGLRPDEASRWFDRMLFNVAIGNTDDHPLNHLFGWDGRHLSLMPAFDLEPQLSAAEDRLHEMVIGRAGKEGSLENVLSQHAEFGLRLDQAEERVQRMLAVIRSNWRQALEMVGLPDTSSVRYALMADVREHPADRGDNEGEDQGASMSM